MVVERKRYVFLYPSVSIGGAQLLFARLAEELIKRGNKVAVVGNENCFIYTYLKSKSLECDMILSSPKHKGKLESTDLLILSLSYVNHYVDMVDIKDNTRLVFWDLHPNALIENTAFSKVYKEFDGNKFFIKALSVLERNTFNKINSFVELAHKNNSLFFMCSYNFNYNNKFFRINIEPTFLPIPINSSSNKTIDANTRNSFKRTINICWISRLDKDKIGVLRLLIKDLNTFNEHNRESHIQLHIIGDGNAKEEILAEKQIKGNDIVLAGKVFGEDLTSYMERNIDIGFSMGTSALEFASRNIPTVLVPGATQYQYFKKEPNRYIWLHQSRGFDVAVNEYYINNSAVGFGEIINEYKADRTILIKKCYKYVAQSHLFDNVFERFIELAERSSLTSTRLNELGMYKKNGIGRILFGFKRIVKNII